MSPRNSNDLQRIFDKLDLNGDGRVSIDELKEFLDRFGLHTCSLDELKSLIGKTSLNLDEFSVFYDEIAKQDIGEESTSSEDEDNQKCAESDLLKAFKVFDVNGDGLISCEELQSALSMLGLWDEACGRDCKSMIDAYDTNSDGMLDFQEFKDMMLVTKS